MYSSKSNYYDMLYGFRKNMILIFYGLSVLCIILLIWLFLNFTMALSDKIQVGLSFLLAIAGIVGGLFISVYFDLPNISHDFDQIKDDIAKRDIRSPEEFGRRVVKLLCGFFNFQFFNIQYSFIKIIDTDYIYSDHDIRKVGNLDLDNMSDDLISESQEKEEIFYKTRVQINSKEYFLYILPIWFGEDWLGFIGILTPKKVSRLFLLFLNTFENESLDDQLIHVLNYKKSQIQKQFYRSLDIISNKITKNEYDDIVSFQYDVLHLLINELSCLGGLFASIYHNEIVSHFIDDPNRGQHTIQYYTRCFADNDIANEARINTNIDIDFTYIFEIPISIDELQGVIILFDNHKRKFEYFESTLLEIENIKLDNDLENLARLLNLSRDANSPLAVNR